MSQAILSPATLDSWFSELLPPASSERLPSKTWDPDFFKGQRVLITGAGGFIGQELTKRILQCHPERLLACDQSEIGLHQLHSYVEAVCPEEKSLSLVLGSVMDFSFLDDLCARERPHIIIHAAAYKHVNLVEQNTAIAYANNLLATWHVLQVAQNYAVKHCLLVSSDKAKHPCNAMGYSKYWAELLFQYSALENPHIDYRVVRFGNVFGSSGSLIPKLLEQISNAWDVTITDSRATRYFMSLSDAVDLTLCAMQLDDARGVFSLDMGQPVLIRDLMEGFIKKYRKAIDPNLNLRMREIGLYPGERLHEPSLIDEDSDHTAHPRIYRSTFDLPLGSEDFWMLWQRLLTTLSTSHIDPKLLSVIPRATPER